MVVIVIVNPSWACLRRRQGFQAWAALPSWLVDGAISDVTLYAKAKPPQLCAVAAARTWSTGEEEMVAPRLQPRLRRPAFVEGCASRTGRARAGSAPPGS